MFDKEQVEAIFRSAGRGCLELFMYEAGFGEVDWDVVREQVLASPAVPVREHAAEVLGIRREGMDRGSYSAKIGGHLDHSQRYIKLALQGFIVDGQIRGDPKLTLEYHTASLRDVNGTDFDDSMILLSHLMLRVPQVHSEHRNVDSGILIVSSEALPPESLPVVARAAGYVDRSVTNG